jgi:hypothetical protein
MTEQERDHMLLSRLIEQPPEQSDTPSNAALSIGQERTLLQEANQVPPATLAPADTGVQSAGNRSFAGEALDIVRRHPLPALLFAAGIAYLITSSRRRSRG